MAIRGIHHVQITIPCGCEDAARAFYCGVLGLVEVDKPGSLTSRGGLWLQLGEQQLHIGVEDGPDRTATKAHAAYLVDDLPAMQARLADAGVAITESIPIPGYARFEFRDPFDNRVECIAHSAPH